MFISKWFCEVCVVFPFSYPIFGPRMSSALRISCLVTRRLGIRFLSTYFIRSWVQGLPM